MPNQPCSMNAGIAVCFLLYPLSSHYPHLLSIHAFFSLSLLPLVPHPSLSVHPSLITSTCLTARDSLSRVWGGLMRREGLDAEPTMFNECWDCCLLSVIPSVISLSTSIIHPCVLLSVSAALSPPPKPVCPSKPDYKYLLDRAFDQHDFLNVLICKLALNILPGGLRKVLIVPLSLCNVPLLLCNVLLLYTQLTGTAVVTHQQSQVQKATPSTGHTPKSSQQPLQARRHRSPLHSAARNRPALWQMLKSQLNLLPGPCRLLRHPSQALITKPQQHIGVPPLICAR